MNNDNAAQLGAALVREEWKRRLEDDVANSVQFTAADVLADRLYLIDALEHRLKTCGPLLDRIFAELESEVDE